MQDEAYRARARGLVRAEMARRNVTFRELTRRLEAIGIEETHTNLRAKIHRGAFTVPLLLAIMDVLGVSELRLK